MDFEEWYKDFTKDFNFPEMCEKQGYYIAWNACKYEVLKILKGKEDFIGSGIKTAIKEVEKL